MSEEEWMDWIHDPLYFEKGGAMITRWAWVDMLFKKHILPIFKNKGFELSGKPEKAMRRFLWFWRHLSLCGYDSADPISGPEVSKSLTRPLREYYDIFFHCFNYSAFDNLAENMCASEGAFDDTYLGRRLLAELPNFLWSCIDLVSSLTFIKHEKVCAEYDEAIRQIEESEISIEELDRRRMKKNSGYDPDYVYDKHN
jgi:hypothetical protein